MVTKMNEKGVLAVVSGFSGAGKGTVVKKLLNTYDNYSLSISATTRSPRTGETDGKEYFFKTVDEFKKMIDNDELIEYAQYVGNYYGTPKEYVKTQLDSGRNVILEIEIQGALNIKKMFPEAILIFITPPSAKELQKRLRGRGTEDDATINARLARPVVEADEAINYDCVVINDTVDKCVETINSIVNGEKYNSSDNLELIKQIKNDLKVYSEGESK